MTEIILGFVLVVVVIALALYGLIKLLTGGASKPSGLTEFSGTKNDNSQRCLKQDVQGSSHLLNYLYLQKRISRKQYDRLRGYLDQEYGGQWKLADELPKADGQVLSKPKEITESKQSVEPELKSGSDAGSKVDVEFVSDLVRDAGSEPIVTESPAGPPATEASPLTGKRSLGPLARSCQASCLRRIFAGASWPAAFSSLAVRLGWLSVCAKSFARRFRIFHR